MMRRFSRTFWTDGITQPGAAALSGPNFDLPASGLLLAPEPPSETACATRVCSLHPAGLPVGVYTPECYEPNYAYPLLVWLHGTGGNERDLFDLMPGISTRNYFGLSLRGPQRLDHDAWDWETAELSRIEGELHETVCRFRREYHIHSERIFIAGFDSGATLALRLLLSRPEWFGGGIAVSGGLPKTDKAMSRYRELQGKPVLIGASRRDPITPASEMASTARLLHAAGLNVTTKLDDADHEVTPKMLGDINHWVMENLCTTV